MEEHCFKNNNSKSEDQIQRKIFTERLILEHLSLEDSEAFVKYFNNINVVKRFSNSTLLPYSLENAIEDIEYYMQQDHISFAIKLKSNPKELIGLFSFQILNFSQKKYWICYWLGEPFWRKGIMSEVGDALLRYIFCQIGAEIIETGIDTDNIGSINLIKHLKFRFLRTEKDDDFIQCTQEMLDCNYYELTRNEYFQNVANSKPLISTYLIVFILIFVWMILDLTVL